MVARGPKVKVNVPKLAPPKEWTKKLTPVENYAHLGITIDPNASKDFHSRVLETRKREKPNVQHSGLRIEDGLPNVPLSDEPSLPSSIPDYRINQLQELIKRYGTDYKKMELDRKYNYKQETAKQLKHAVAIYQMWKKKKDELLKKDLNKKLKEEREHLETQKTLTKIVKESMDFDEIDPKIIVKKTKSLIEPRKTVKEEENKQFSKKNISTSNTKIVNDAPKEKVSQKRKRDHSESQRKSESSKRRATSD